MSPEWITTLSLVLNVLLIAGILGSVQGRKLSRAITEISHEIDIYAAVLKERAKHLHVKEDE